MSILTQLQGMTRKSEKFKFIDQGQGAGKISRKYREKTEVVGFFMQSHSKKLQSYPWEGGSILSCHWYRDRGSHTARLFQIWGICYKGVYPLTFFNVYCCVAKAPRQAVCLNDHEEGYVKVHCLVVEPKLKFQKRPEILAGTGFWAFLFPKELVPFGNSQPIFSVDSPI